MNKSYTVAGVSSLNGIFKFRVANDISRVKVLNKAGHANVDLVELPVAMDKQAAAQYLVSIQFDDGRAEVLHALESELARYVEQPKRPVGRPRKTPVSETAMLEEPVAEMA